MKHYDLVVVGGGTAGCAAAYIAGKLGLKTLIIEKRIHLGGTITSGLVIPAMKSSDNQINTWFYHALIEELKSLGGQVTYLGNPGWFNPELTKIALDSLMAKAGVDVYFDTHITKIQLKNSTIKTITISKQILSLYNDEVHEQIKKLSVPIAARYVVDSTGNCEVGKFCGCQFLEKKVENQPVSLRFIMGGVDLKKFGNWLKEYDKDRSVTTVEEIDGQIHLSTAYTWDKNKDWALRPLFKDAERKKILKPIDSNYFQIFTVAGMPGNVAFNCPRIINYNEILAVRDTSKALLLARKTILRLAKFCKEYFPGFENSYISNIADMLGVRTSRRIKGKYVYTMGDIISGKKFDTPLVVANYPIDVHSKKKNASILTMVQDYQIPIECTMSADVKNLFVAGRCISADFMAQGALRVQTSCFSMGEGIAKYIAKTIKNEENKD